MKSALIFALIAFAIALVIAPFLLKFLRKLKAGQQVLHYVELHKQKSGTPTMGGIIFILPMIILAGFVINRDTPLALIAVLASMGYALVGFLDDFIKIKFKKNQGLRAYQKIIAQGGIAILVSIFYFMANLDGRILIPFLNTYWDIGWVILPLTFIVLIATTNSVNLTDGLDGLAGMVSLIYLIFISFLIALTANFMNLAESNTFIALAAITCGGLVCFLIFNTNKAKVFMGDTGSLYLGSIIATLSMFSFLGFYILILGVMFVVSAVSDIVQVAYFKKTGGKRVFLMAPFHHHLEMRGWSEAKIVFLYCAVTVVAGTACVIFLV